MMDALSAPRLPVSEGPASPPSASRADKADDTGSFSKVLSKSGERESGAPNQERASDDSETPDTEIKDASAKPPLRTGERSLQVLDDTLLAELDALPDNLSTEDLMKALAKAQVQGKGETPAAKEPEVEIEGLDPEIKAQLAKAMMAIRDRKEPAEASATPTDQIAAEVATAEGSPATDGPIAGLADVLQLLTSAQADVSEKTGEVAKGDKNGKDEQKVIVGLPMVAQNEDSGEASLSDEQQSEGDRDFRFIRADGKGQPLLLRSEATAGPEQTEPKVVETVTVVDSRRYIAPASTTNAASITAAMLGDGEWVSAMSHGSELANAAAQSSQGKVVHTLKLQMTPIELGSVTATLRLNGEELSVQLAVDNPAAYRQLQNDQSDMLKALRAQGLVVDQVQVIMQMSPADRSADSGQNGNQNQQSSQQTGQQAFQSGNQSGNERQSQRSDTSGTMVRTTDERVVQAADVPASGNRNARPDQLYV